METRHTKLNSKARDCVGDGSHSQLRAHDGVPVWQGRRLVEATPRRVPELVDADRDLITPALPSSTPLHSQHGPVLGSLLPAGQSQQGLLAGPDPPSRTNCENAALGQRPPVLFDISGMRLNPSVQSAVARLCLVSSGQCGTMVGPPATCMVAASIRVGKRSTCSTRASVRPGGMPGTCCKVGQQPAVSSQSQTTPPLQRQAG